MFRDCVEPTCQGGGCHFHDSHAPECAGGGCRFIRPKRLHKDNHCRGGRCTHSNEAEPEEQRRTTADDATSAETKAPAEAKAPAETETSGKTEATAETEPEPDTDAQAEELARDALKAAQEEEEGEEGLEDEAELLANAREAASRSKDEVGEESHRNEL